MILGIDQGTTGTTAVCLSVDGQILSSATADVPQHFPEPGWVEHDPEEIWQSVERAIGLAIQKSGRSPRDIKAIGITNQRETVSLFGGAKPLHRFIVWQDRRTTKECEKLKSKEKKIRKLSGLPVDPYFSASKIRYLLKKLKLSSGRSRKDLRFRTIESFLISRMTGEDVTEATNASRTSLMNLKKISWDEVLLNTFGVPRSLCPNIIPSEGFSFKTCGLSFLPDGIPVTASLGDQQAALFGQLGFQKGAGKITYGTGSFVLLNTGEAPAISRNGLVSTLAIQWRNRKALYALEGSAFICGAWIQWLRDQLHILPDAAASETFALAASNPDGVIVVPALTGMGAPFWKPQMRGAILGLTRGSSREHLMRASLEALAFQNHALISAMKKDAPKLKTSWRVDGGGTQNNLLMQIQANILQEKILRPRNMEATALGVAWLAAVSKGLLSLQDLESLWSAEREFVPEKNSGPLAGRYAAWLSAIDRLS